MAKPLPVNRELVKALFIKGLPASEIAPQFGVTSNQVRVWATRGGWIKERETNTIPKDLAIQDVATEFSNRAVSIARNLMMKLENMPVADPRDVKDCSVALASSYATARKALGMDDASAVQRHVHYHVMDRARASVAQGASVIDIEPAQPTQVADVPPYSEIPAGRPEEAVIAAELAKDESDQGQN